MSLLRTRLRRVGAAALDLLAPPACLACARGASERGGLCRDCLVRLPGLGPAPCPRCAGALGPGIAPDACQDCERLRPRFTATLAVGPYAGFLGELVRRTKYGPDPLLAAPLAYLLARAVERWPEAQGATCVVPVPGSRTRVRERGFDLSALLARRAAAALGVPCREQLLRRVGDPAPQATLTRTERRLAARGTVGTLARWTPWTPWTSATRWTPRAAWTAWAAQPDLVGESVLLVDDVLTTGATAQACAHELERVGACEVRVAIVARA